MGILTNRKPTLSKQLKENGFVANKRWGNPSGWGKTTIFYEKIVVVKTEGSKRFVSILYFPKAFDAYVPAFQMKLGISPANHMMFIMDTIGSSGDKTYDIHIKDYDDVEVIIQDYLKSIKGKIINSEY